MLNALQSNAKIFVGDSSLFSIVQDITTSTVSLNNDLTKISEWAVQWKINFNPDPCKQDENPAHQVKLQIHLGLLLDPNLSFDEHIQCILNKTRKIIGLIRKLQPIIPRAALLTIYKSFLRPHLDYGNVLHNHSFKESFQNKLESV